jgi:hypothetical protein
MRYESVVKSTGGDDVALAKPFIIVCEGQVLNWYSLLQPHSVCSWVNLKTKFMQAFQIFSCNNNRVIRPVQLQTERLKAIAELRKKIHAAKIPNS